VSKELSAREDGARSPYSPSPAGGPLAGTREVKLDFDPFAESDEDGLHALNEGFGNYAAWRRARGLELIDAQLHAERLSRWRIRPRFLLVAFASIEEFPRVARTLDDLQRQMYPDWCLTVVSDQASPSPLFGSTPSLEWIQVPSLNDHDAVAELLNALAAGAGYDWLAVLPAGFGLTGNALLVLGDYIDSRPGCAAFFTDDDEVDADGGHSRPRFKPDLDIDFLRGCDYVTPAVWFRAEAVQALGGFAPLGPAMPYEFLLRLWEAVGDAGIAHIAQPLLHLPAGGGGSASGPKLPALQTAAVMAHLERLGLPARVGPGLIDGTRRLVWEWSDAPKVTIVIPTRDKLEFVQPCVESVLGITAYTNYEILLVDHASSDPDALAWLEEIVAKHAGRVRRIHFDGEFDLAAINNRAAESSAAEYLCLLHNDTEVIQGEWLSRLLEIGRRPDVAAVGARLVFPESGDIQHAGLVLGLGPDGIAGTPFAGVYGLLEPGPLSRMQVVHACSAVSAACMLVRREDYLAVGGMDSPGFARSYADVDLCLRLQRSGGRVLWTPFATLVHYTGASQDLQARGPAEQVRMLECRAAERDRMLERWLPQIAADPFYNANLGLPWNDFRLEATLRPPWDVNFKDRERVLGIPLSSGAGTFRVKEPFDALADAGRVHIMYPITGASIRVPSVVDIARLGPDRLLLHSLLDDHCLDFLRRNQRINPGVMRMFGLDDLVTQVPKKSNVWRYFTMHYRDVRPRLREALRLCDRLIVSTDPLADLCRGMIDDIRVVPNRLSKVWRGHASRRNIGSRPRVGWVGALQHQGDLEVIDPVIEALAGEVDFVFMGMATDRIRPHLAEFHPAVPWEEYPAKVASLDLDIALAPLELLPFNEAKSNLRLLEYGMFGWPVVCTDIFPYRHDRAPVTRVSNDPAAWIDAIRALVAEPARRAAEGDALQEWVTRSYLLEDHLDDWADALLD